MSVLLSLLPLLTAGSISSDPVYRRLESGAAIVVESRGGDIASIQLFAAARACPETASSHGHRHLLEHLLAKGADGKLGERLEREGWFLSAETYRDFMVFKLTGVASRWEKASEAITEILAGWRHPTETIESEALVIEQEAAILPKSTRISAEAWQRAYGAFGLDPIGSSTTIGGATPESLAALHLRQFARNQLTVSVAGPIDPRAVIDKFSTVLSKSPKAVEARWSRSAVGQSGAVQIPGCAAVYISCGPYSTSETAALVGLACLLGTELDQGFVTYTPSQSAGLVIVGTSAGEDIAPIRKAIQSSAAELGQVREMASRWATAGSLSAAACAWWNGVFQVQAAGGKPDIFTSAIDNMSQADVDSAIAKLRGAVEGGGN